MSTAKENILKRIRQALSNPTPLPFSQSEGDSSVFNNPTGDLEVTFAEQFTQLQGKFAFCINEKDMLQQLQQLIAQKQWKKIYCSEDKWSELLGNTVDLANCDASITTCEYLVARTGSVVLTAAQQSGRTVSVYGPVHICIAYTHQLLYDIKDALQLLKLKYGADFPSLVTFATGPSRTADIEKTLVTGVHGPKEVYCFLIEKQL